MRQPAVPGASFDMEVKNLRRQLQDVAERLESHFQDMCHVEFTVQEGKLYVLGARVGKRTARAALRIATDLFLEGKITGKTLVSRIEPDQVEALLKPTVIVNSNLRELGRGLPASSGAATGVAAFSAESAVRIGAAGSPAIFVCAEAVPDDIHGLEASAGVISFLGGMTSHAAVWSRGMGKPCVTALQWRFDRRKRVASTPRGNVREGDPLTIDGTAGIVYAGKAEIESPKALQNERLLLLFRVIEALSAENELPPECIGKAWHVRDIMLRGPMRWDQQDPAHQLERWPVGAERPAKAFDPLSPPHLEHMCEELLLFRLDPAWNDHAEIWGGLRTFLLRLMSQNVGLGRHHEFWRPLFDPCHSILDAISASGWRCRDGSRVQLVGEEFFSINFHVPELIDIATIRIYWAVECKNPQQLWRLDRTNPAGEKLLQGSANLTALKIVVNDATVPQDTLGAFYNALRRREYYWNWYNANSICRREIIDGMMNRKGALPVRVRALAQRAGLVSGQSAITRVGESLLRPSTASERAHSSFRIGW
jgi:phosphohistidine swiveling domain-containing protein